MNKDYLSIARQRLESQCIISSNRIMITFILTTGIMKGISMFLSLTILKILQEQWNN